MKSKYDSGCSWWAKAILKIEKNRVEIKKKCYNTIMCMRLVVEVNILAGVISVNMRFPGWMGHSTNKRKQ